MKPLQSMKKINFFHLLFLLSIALAAVFCIVSVVQSAHLQQVEHQLSSMRGETSRADHLQDQLQDLTAKYDDLSSRMAIRQSFSETHASDGTKIAYLTFDDGPSKNTSQLLQALKQSNVKATFFVIGLNCQQYPDAVKNEAAGGHVVGIHSWTHKYEYIYANMDNFKQDFMQLHDYLTQQLGSEPTICRFPGGTNNTVSKKYTKEPIMQEAVNWVEGMDIRPIDWDADAGDAETPIPTKDQIVQRVLREIGHKTNPVILMHDFGNRTSTIEAVPLIVQQLQAQGYTFGTLSAATPATLFKPVVTAAS
ncbi:polysaccharide deacetylase family protein [Ethanoligenens harbinense]|uniref:Polysaccharide deacetylase n=1 Tax=Ethanoligenens harbinense (strain DSM 18485 / JCM 12961 / CGMCC 1.5033 / YUAN-3) TaxID=663278 RepID=E6U5X9_ETHHY|nr:polysaccharide deacetylase family protein [Ethanoligenens harbinense]ADU27996.1 polysaccharide deacetylase [Ethanoligenens harbinense YUAN-3]AVQ97016.1 polysaccharide deacetylase [Ethanoligenens harbinense YUAN-3]AYF39677.1 polysaccharide deacetylase [Ethanoligenens harbinense]AYF42508.1 polysaccharide deacetylase [Ethanoligenens harbinense]QCN93258.1 polysaccharide deacetylase [Ethanoligenens harbinense]